MPRLVIPVFDKETERIENYELKQVYESSVIDSNFELVGKRTLNVIAVRTLLNNDRYIIDIHDLKRIIFTLDINVKVLKRSK